MKGPAVRVNSTVKGRSQQPIQHFLVGWRLLVPISSLYGKSADHCDFVTLNVDFELKSAEMFTLTITKSVPIQTEGSRFLSFGVPSLSILVEWLDSLKSTGLPLRKTFSNWLRAMRYHVARQLDSKRMTTICQSPHSVGYTCSFQPPYLERHQQQGTSDATHSRCYLLGFFSNWKVFRVISNVVIIYLTKDKQKA